MNNLTISSYMNVLLLKVKAGNFAKHLGTIAEYDRYVSYYADDKHSRWALNMLVPGNDGSLDNDELALAYQRAKYLNWDLRVVE